MAFDGSKPRSSHFGGLGDRHSDHEANILKRTLLDGQVKLFEDSTGFAERMEIFLPKGKVVIYKDFEAAEALAKYKKIVILSEDGISKGTIELIPRDRKNPNPVYRCFIDRVEIGSGYGDISFYVAHQLLGGSIDPRSGVGTSVDPEVIATIKQIIGSRTV
jgi:hypothetical protein